MLTWTYLTHAEATHQPVLTLSNEFWKAHVKTWSDPPSFFHSRMTERWFEIETWFENLKCYDEIFCESWKACGQSNYWNKLSQNYKAAVVNLLLINHKEGLLLGKHGLNFGTDSLLVACEIIVATWKCSRVRCRARN